MKTSLIIALIFFTLICSSIFSYAQTEASFIYESEGRRDPFIPLITKEGKLLVTYGVITSINDVVLEGILYDPEGESIVILNDLVLKENDQVGNIKVERIEKNRVILSCKGEEHIFKTKE